MSLIHSIHIATVRPDMIICWFAITRVCFFLAHLSSQKKKFDEKDSINTYLLNLIFKLFALLHFVCLVLLECACYNYEFSLLQQLHGTSLPQLSPLSIFVDWMMVQPFTGGADQWKLEPELFLSCFALFTQNMCF